MRYLKWIGLAAAVLLVVSCFTPWIFIQSANITVSGIDTTGTNFCKPGYFHFVLAGLFLLSLALAQAKGQLSDADEAAHLKAMRHLPVALQAVLALEPQVISWAEDFAKMENALFLGRGLHYPIALEGALKLKEISYIHAEAYPAGELKHGPLALVTSAMPVVTVAPNDALLEKLKSNMQ